MYIKVVKQAIITHFPYLKVIHSIIIICKITKIRSSSNNNNKNNKNNNNNHLKQIMKITTKIILPTGA